MNIIKKIFLSSSGNGNMSAMWKGIIVTVLLSLFPDTEQGTALALADQILLILSGGYAVYGALRKLWLNKWSVVK